MQSKLITTLLLTLLLPVALAAKGKITGSVKDSVTGEPLIGVSVTLMNVGDTTPVMGSVTGIDGDFVFEIASGVYRVSADYLGYQSKILDGIRISDGATIAVSMALSVEKNKELEEVIVSATSRKETIGALYTMQKNALSVSDGISAEAIKNAPDRNTGEVLKRISGTTIQDNKFVIVRGLSDRYNTALVDGAVMPSTEPNRKAFSFDIIPSAMIDHIVVTKAATPDLPGDFAGGAIQIATKGVPDAHFNTISIGTGYYAAATGQSFQSGYRGSTDFLGFAGKERQLPADFPSQSEINNHPERSEANLKKLHNDFAIRERTALPPISLSAAIGRRYITKSSNRFGLTAAVNYSHTETVQRDLLRQYDNYDYTDNSYRYSSNLGALLNLGYYFGKSKISLKTFYNRIFDDRLLVREGRNYSSSSMIRYYAFDLMQKSLFKTTLSGAHDFGSKGATLDWLLSYNYITNNQPDQRKVSYSRPFDRAEAPYAADITSLGKANNRLFSDLGESIVNGGANYYLPFAFLKQSALKTGVLLQYRHRDFHNRYLGAVLDPQFPEGAAVRNLPIDELFSPETIDRNPYFLEEQTLDADQYTADAQTLAGYVLLDNRITEDLRLAWGVRVENYGIKIHSASKNVADKQWLDVLPSVNLTYALTDRINLRGSYFRSVARPEFREMTNLPYYDYELSATMGGNPDLLRTQINNMDLRFEWFPKTGEVVSASLFYKQFTNAIESRVYGANSSYDISPFNSPDARVMGAEIEIRKNLGFLANHTVFNNLYLYLNLAYIHSEAEAEGLFVRGEKLDHRPLSGQAPYVINTGVGYTSNNGRLNLHALYNRIGQRLAFIGQDRMGLIYESPRNLLDFQASYKVSKRSTLRFSIKDLLNDPVQFYFDQNSDQQFNGSAFQGSHITDGQDWIWRSYRPGTSYSISYSLTF